MNNPNWQQWLGKRLLLGVKHAVLERNASMGPRSC